MLFIGIVLVFLVYAALYLVWDAANVSMHGTEGVLRSLTNALLRPENEVFFILRSLLVLALLYVIADHFFSGAKRALKARRPKEEVIQPTFRETNDHVYRDS
jgi:uncharacterized metal-binding protein